MGYPNAALSHTQQTGSAAQEVMSSHNNNNDQRRPASYNASGGGVRPRPPVPGGGNPMVNYPQRPAQNVAPPLHSNSPGEYQYRFVQAPAFPRHPPLPQTQPNNNQHHRPANHSMATPTSGGHPQLMPSSSSQQRSHVTPSTEQFSNRNSREVVAPPVHSSHNGQYHQLESTV